uniref:Uncharacterized protein n=1 Tax=Arundo donax TaxID=35708 RepID=A0A0A9EMS0_ARUDO
MSIFFRRRQHHSISYINCPLILIIIYIYIYIYISHKNSSRLPVFIRISQKDK